MANLVIPFDKYYDSKNVISVVSSTEDLDDGFVVVANTLVAGELDAYVAGIPAAITADDLAMVAGSEVYEDALGNRPGITDKTQYVYPKGNMVTAYRLSKYARFFISNSAIVGTPDVDKYLIPTANAHTWTVASDLTGGSKVALKIEKANFSGAFAGFAKVTGVVARVVVS